MKYNFSLSDNFTISGNNYDDLKDAVEEFKKTVKYHRIKSSDIQLLSHIATAKDGDIDYLFKIGEKEVSFQREIIIYTLLEKGVSLTDVDVVAEVKNLEKRYGKAIVSLNKKSLLSKGDFEYMLDELRKNRLMLCIPGKEAFTRKFVFTTESLLTTLDRFGLKGGFLARPSIARDILVEQELINGNKDITLVCRSINNVEKCFSILSGKYTPIDQSVIFSLIDKIEKEGSLGKPVCSEWVIDHFYTRAYFDFPDKAKEITNFYGKKETFIPGICISTSDTGDCSLKVSGTFRIGNSRIIQKEVLHKHIGEYNEEKFLEDVSRQIFAEFTKLPEALCDLMSVDIGDPELDLSVEENCVINADYYKDALVSAFSQLDITDAVGIKIKKQLLEAMIDEIDGSVNYTAYDVAVSLMRLPERVGKISSLAALQKAVSLAPFISYEPVTVTLAP